MKKKKFIDPNISIKSRKIDEEFQYMPGSSIPMPSEVEISESGTCAQSSMFFLS